MTTTPPPPLPEGPREPTLVELLEAEARHRLTGDCADHVVYGQLRAASQRLREALDRAQEDRRTTADFGEVEASRACDLVCLHDAAVPGDGER